MVLRLLDKETLTKEEVLEVFAPVDKRPGRPTPTGNGRRQPDGRPPVLTPAELAVMGPADLEDLARGRSGGSRRRIPGRAAPARGRGTTASINREAAEPEPEPRRRRAPRRAAGTDPAS